MKAYFKLLQIFIIALVMVSCVKNEPFLKNYSVPSTYTPETKDSSALARVIMMHGIYNYLSTSPNVQLSFATLDSLWINSDSTFTNAMVPDFVYTDAILNRMVLVNLSGGTTDADSIKLLADSVVYFSNFNKIAGSNGVAGVQQQSSPLSVKRLFSEKGVEYSEVWFNAMLGAMSMSRAFANYTTTTSGATAAWDLSYKYIGFPDSYDPALNYTTTSVKASRPLAVAQLFAGAKSINAGAKIYEEYRRAKASALASNFAVAAASIDTLKRMVEKTIAYTAVTALDSAKQINDNAAKLHYLSQAYGLVRALKYRGAGVLSDADYLQMRTIFKENFYTLTQEISFTQINQLRSILATAYDL